MTSTERRPSALSATFNDALLPVTQCAAPTASAGAAAAWAQQQQQQQQQAPRQAPLP